jgi:hypothetical protein
MAAYVPTDLVSTLVEAKTRFNNGYYDSYSELLDQNVEMKEVDPTLSGTGGPGAIHSPKGAVLDYLKNTQKDKNPQFDEGDHNSWNVAVDVNGTIGIVSGTGTYQDDKRVNKVSQVKYCFVFKRADPTANWLLAVAFASRLPSS